MPTDYRRGAKGISMRGYTKEKKGEQGIRKAHVDLLPALHKSFRW